MFQVGDIVRAKTYNNIKGINLLVIGEDCECYKVSNVNDNTQALIDKNNVKFFELVVPKGGYNRRKLRIC